MQLLDVLYHFLSSPCVSVLLVVCVKEYITVSQLSQIFGMQRLDPTSSSSTPSFQLASTESTFSCHSTACGPSSFLSAQVCYSLPFPTLKLSTEQFLLLQGLFHVYLSYLLDASAPLSPLWLDASHHLRASPS